MNIYLSSECTELQTELLQHQSTDLPPNLTSIKSEVGDILFDALMLNHISSRRYNYTVEECFDVAAAKVERRTSYMEVSERSERKTRKRGLDRKRRQFLFLYWS